MRNPIGAVRHATMPLYRNSAVAFTSHVPLGAHVLRQDWDLLIILDTCRVDALREIAREYEFIERIDDVWSIGGSSPEWMVHTFDSAWRDSLKNTAYLTSNAWAERVLEDRLAPGDAYTGHEIIERLRRFGEWDLIDPAHLGRFEKIWKYVPENEKSTGRQDPAGLMPGGAPPEYVTDRGIAVGREGDHDRLILHYMQPHAPYSANAIREKRGLYEYEESPFSYLNDSGDRNTVWTSYLDELRYVLDEISSLLKNIDAEKVVVSADHGEAFGEYSVYNHHTGSIHPKIRKVPWVTTSATDTRTRSTHIEPRERDSVSVEDTLGALGYIA